MTGTRPDSPPDDADAPRDSLTDAFDESAANVAAFVDRLDAVNELLDAAAREVGVLRGDPDATPPDGADVAAALTDAADGPAADAVAGLAEATGRDGDDVAAAVEAVAELHREGALSGVADSVTEEDAVRAVEAFVDAYRDPEVDGGVGYLVAAVNALGRDGGPDENENESERDAA